MDANQNPESDELKALRERVGVLASELDEMQRGLQEAMQCGLQLKEERNVARAQLFDLRAAIEAYHSYNSPENYARIIQLARGRGLPALTASLTD